MCQLDGYGPKGEEAGRPGYDNTAFWARGGFMYSQAVYGDSNDTYPVYMPMGFGDTTCALGMMAATGFRCFKRKTDRKGRPCFPKPLRNCCMAGKHPCFRFPVWF